jgi:hypothetical protein
MTLNYLITVFPTVSHYNYMTDGILWHSQITYAVSNMANWLPDRGTRFSNINSSTRQLGVSGGTGDIQTLKFAIVWHVAPVVSYCWQKFWLGWREFWIKLACVDIWAWTFMGHPYLEVVHPPATVLPPILHIFLNPLHLLFNFRLLRWYSICGGNRAVLTPYGTCTRFHSDEEILNIRLFCSLPKLPRKVVALLALICFSWKDWLMRPCSALLCCCSEVPETALAPLSHRRKWCTSLRAIVCRPKFTLVVSLDKIKFVCNRV